MSTTALLFATTPSADGGPAAALAVGDTTLVRRLLGQLAGLGIQRSFVVTRPEWSERIEAAIDGTGAGVAVRVSSDLREDLLTAAGVAREAPGRLLIGLADALVHRRPLAVLLTDPRIQTGVISTGSRRRAGWGYAIRSVRGRLVAASSPYHRVARPNGYLLGFGVVAHADLERLAVAATELAEYAGEPRDPRWEEELERKTAGWRAQLWRASLAPEQQALVEASAIDAATLPLDRAAEDLLTLRGRAAREDVLSLLVVGLVRSGVQVGTSALRAFFHARPLSADAVAEATHELDGQDEDRLALTSAVKAVDGFFTTFFVSPYSRYIARFAARRGWTPNAMTTVSMVIGLLAAAAFAAGSRAGMIAGAVLLQAAFTVDCVDGQLARYTLTFSKLGAWLDSVFDRAKEYVVFAGLAIGASRGFDQDVWTLAAAALALQTFRHAIDFSFAAGRHGVIATQVHPPLGEPGPIAPEPGVRTPAAPVSATVPAESAGGAVAVAVRAPAEQAPPHVIEVEAPDARDLARRALHAVGSLDRFTPLRWARRIFLLPIGERFALISLTAALGSPRLTFVALLAWGGVVTVYALVGRTLRSVIA